MPKINSEPNMGEFMGWPDMDNAMTHPTSNFENEDVMKSTKQPNDFVSFEQLQAPPPVLQRQNGAIYSTQSVAFTHISGNDGVEDLTEKISHLGEEAYNIDMANALHAFSDNWHYEIHPNTVHNASFEQLHIGDGNSSIGTIGFNPLEPYPQSSFPQSNNWQQAHGDFTFPQVSFPNTQQGSCLPSTPTAALPPTRPVVEKIPPDTQLFTFPPSGSCTTGMDPVVLLVKDIKTLDRKEFLNDSVMAFMLNYIAFMLSSELMKSVHMCNTFLFVNLTRLLPPLCFSKRRPIEPEHIKIVKDNCPRVLRWTRKFDVLAKDYIIIPINEDLHWLVIAVINPSGAIVDMSNEEASRAAPKCYIVFFDPLSGLDPSKKNHMCHCIKIYLAQLYENTKAPGMKFASKNPTIYDEERVVVTRAENTPIQDNFYDCGLYVLHFIEGLFCYPNRPVNVNDFPNFDWSKFFPEANKMCDLMRDKVYNLILQQADKPARSRLAKFERENKCGLSREGALRKARRHSAVNERRTKRHRDYYARHYSLSPPHRNVMNDDPTFMNPRGLAEMPITRLVRRLRIPEDNFPIAY